MDPVINPQLHTNRSEIGETDSHPAIRETGCSSKEKDTETKSDIQEKLTAKFGNMSVSLMGNFLAIKRFFCNQWRSYFHNDSTIQTRVYHVWQANNVFFFHGRLVCGPDPRGLLLTTTSIVLSTSIFAIYIGNDLGHYSGLIVALTIILAIVVLASLLLVSSLDPGIIPRSNQEPVEESGISTNQIRRKRVVVNGISFKLKYCRICKIFRPPRSYHCAICNSCFDRFDHHCPWIGQCIALRNYRFFVMFVVSAFVFFAYVFVFSFWRIHRRMLENGIGLLGVLKNCPETAALILFTFSAVWFLGCLLFFHAYLITTNQTSYESFDEQFVGSQNPFDRGVLRNVMEILCEPLPPSKVDFRAEVTQPWHTTATR